MVKAGASDCEGCSDGRNGSRSELVGAAFVQFPVYDVALEVAAGVVQWTSEP